MPDDQRNLSALTLWMPAFVYPAFKRIAWRWCKAATFHPYPSFRWARVEVGRG